MQKTWTWSTYVSTFIGQPVEAILESCQYAGLSAVDGTYRFFQNHSDAEMDAFAKVLRNCPSRSCRPDSDLDGESLSDGRVGRDFASDNYGL